MNKRAFTLTELIAVIVIIGLILLTAVPAVYKLLTDNKNKKYDYYYEMVKEAAYAYAKVKKDELGNSFNSGCVSATVGDLVNGEFLKEFNKDGNRVTDSQIIINNDHGKIAVDVYLKIGNIYTKGDKKDNIDALCSNYTYSVKTLRSVIKEKVSNNNYVGAGNINANYVWYSGRLWRAIFIDTKGNIKLVSDEVVGTIPFNINGTNSDFKNSYIEKWLNDYFLNNLYNYNKYIVTYDWGGSSKKVGLVSKSDVDNISFLSSTNWTLTSNNNNVYLMNNTDVIYSSVHGVRPSVFIKANIKVVDGNGTLENPYQLEGNRISSQENKLINSRYSGEYVKARTGTNKYRIVSTSEDNVKLISVNTINNQSDVSSVTSPIYTLIEQQANDDFGSLLTPSEWYLGNITNSLNYIIGNINMSTRSFKVGLLMYGEMYSNNQSNTCLWTSTVENDDPDNENLVALKNNTMELIAENGANECDVKYSLYIKGNTKIISGSGVESNPFILE